MNLQTSNNTFRVVLLALLLMPCVSLSAAKRPNIVVLLADDLGWRDIGCYGGPVKTPTLDSLAARGVRLTDFHAGAAICSPSRATLLTGRQHLRTGIYGVLQDHLHNAHLLQREVTIADVLQQTGYRTAHFGKWHLGMTSGKRKKPSPTEHGFDYWFGLSNGAHPSHKDPVNFLRNGEPVGPLEGYSCQLLVDDAIRWLDRKDKPDQPFFLNVWFNEPHHPLAAPDEIVSQYGDLKDEAAIYSAAIDNTDRSIGRLVAKLKDMGELDNTLIVYSSDHGSYRADRNGGLRGNKGSNFEGGLRSPGIFFWPRGFRGGRVENTPTGSVDLLPTICGLVGIEKPPGVHLDGADLSPLLTEQGQFQRTQPLFWLAPTSGQLGTLRDGRYTLMGFRGYDLPEDHATRDKLLQQMARLAGIDEDAKNLRSRVANTTFTSPEFRRLRDEFVKLTTFQESWISIIKSGGFSNFALYDLEADPKQTKDVSRQQAEITLRLKKELLALYRSVMADVPDWGSMDQARSPSNSDVDPSVNRVSGSGDPPTTEGDPPTAARVVERSPDCSTENNPPNVLFVAVDDLNDWVGCLGGHPQAKTPNIDRLAEKGVLFEQAYCTAPLCSPSRTAIMTGLRPSTTGIYGNMAWFRDIPEYADWQTIPQYFRRHGYRALTGGKIYHQPHGKFSDPIAWDEQYSMQMGTPFPPESSRYRHGMHDLFNNKILARLIDWGPIEQPTEQTDDWKTADKAAQFLRQEHDKPFFLACGIYHPHLPWYVPQKYFDMHPLESIQLPARKEDDLDDIPPVGLRMAEKAFGIIKEHGQLRSAVQGRLASGSFADACVGHILDALENSQYRDNTIVVLWGDHGYDIGQKKFAKSALWEQTTRTPLIINAPGISKSGSRCTRPVSLVDLYPTLIDLCGLPDRDDLDGRSLAPLIRAPEAEWPYPAIITHSPHWHGTNHAIRSELYHYIHYSDGGEELYDMPNDPNQWKNLANDPAYSEIKEKLKQWLPKANAEHFRPKQ